MNRYHELGQYAFGKRQAFLWYSSAVAASTAIQILQRKRPLVLMLALIIVPVQARQQVCGPSYHSSSLL